MSREYFIDSYKGLKVVMSIVSVLRVVSPAFDFFCKEEIMAYLSSFDLNLLPWIVFIVIFGKQLKKMELPNWAPPIPVILLLISFIICSLFGWAHCEAEGLKAVIISCVEFGFGNGCLIAFIACYGYDVAHSFIKKSWPSLKAWAVRVFGKKEATSESK